MARKVQRRRGVRLCSPIIPEELIEIEILARLDVKTLHRFKCVSKRYESIISHPKFGLGYTEKAYSSAESMSSSGLRSTMLYPYTDVSRFLRRRGFNLKDLASAGNHTTVPISVNFVSVPDIMNHLIIASTNGLVLSRHDSFTDKRFWVSNPLTKQCIKLPDNDGPVTSFRVQYGFASRRDEATGLLTYKVVAFESPFFKKHEGIPGYRVAATVHTFSSETGRWVVSEVPLPEMYGILCFSHKGSLYFLDRAEGFVLIYNPYDSPGRFDRISLPTCDNFYRMSLVYSEDAVRCWECSDETDDDGGVEVNVWRLEDANTCFERRFRIESPAARVCQLQLVAPYPWDQDVIFHPFLQGKEMAVINQRKGTWQTVTVNPGYQPLINIHLTPWSSPFYTSHQLHVEDKERELQ